MQQIKTMRASSELLALTSPVEADLFAVEEDIIRLIESPIPIIRDVAMHTLSAGGKRLRPLLTLLCAKAFGRINAKVITLASLIEISHTAALIHDDVIDQAKLRRGLPSANGVWGNEATVLVGDYLISQILFMLSHDDFRPYQKLMAVSAKRMCMGQLLEVELRRKVDISQSEYMELIQCKTGELISVACQLGAMAGHAAEEHVEALGEYGLNVGMAFQIVDDILDIVSDSKKLGKPVGNDLREGKITLPYIRTLAVADAADRTRLEALMREADPDASIIEEAAGIVRRYDGLEYSKQVALNYVQAARQRLELIPPTPIKSVLEGLADYIVNRQV
jgi:octaprenyl-diphosphate synthase